MGRSAILKRIRQAVQHAEAPGLPSQIPDFPQFKDPAARFRRELEAVQGHFFDCRQASRLPDVLSEILARCQTEEICWEAPEIFEKHKIPAQPWAPDGFRAGRLAFSRHLGQKVAFPIQIESRPGGKEEMASVRLSASSAAGAIAETGTVVQRVCSGAGRLLGALPPCHLAFVSQRDLILNQREFFLRERFGEQGSATTLVSGPSRTADIEKQLVLGVHGPKQWFAVLTE